MNLVELPKHNPLKLEGISNFYFLISVPTDDTGKVTTPMIQHTAPKSNLPTLCYHGSFILTKHPAYKNSLMAQSRSFMTQTNALMSDWCRTIKVAYSMSSYKPGSGLTQRSLKWCRGLTHTDNPSHGAKYGTSRVQFHEKGWESSHNANTRRTSRLRGNAFSAILMQALGTRSPLLHAWSLVVFCALGHKRGPSTGNCSYSTIQCNVLFLLSG